MPPQLDSEDLGEHAAVPYGKALQNQQAPAGSEDCQHRHTRQPPGGNAVATPDAGNGNRPQLADQDEISGGSKAFGHRWRATPAASAHAGRVGQGVCHTLE